MLFPETLTNWDKELGSEAELKQADVRLCCDSRKTSGVAASEVGLGLMWVGFGLIRRELLLFPFLSTSRGDLFRQSLVTLDFELCTELELPSLADTDVWLESGLITLGPRS